MDLSFFINGFDNILAFVQGFLIYNGPENSGMLLFSFPAPYVPAWLSFQTIFLI